MPKCQADNCQNNAEYVKKETWKYDGNDSAIYEQNQELFSYSVPLCKAHVELDEISMVSSSFIEELPKLTA